MKLTQGNTRVKGISQMKLATSIGSFGAVLAIATALAGCAQATSPQTNTTSGPSSASTAVAGSHNAQDTTFVQMMIVHHQGAIEMADLASTRASDAHVKDLAAKIKAAQQPEIDRMQGWLAAWGEPSADAGMDMSGHDHSGMMMGSDASPEMPGMTSQDMASLETLNGPAFDKRFLELMIAHHEGAVSMSRDETTGGQSPEATALAEDIISAQTTEIATMKKLLDNLK